MAATLATAFRAHQAGHRSEAERLISRRAGGRAAQCHRACICSARSLHQGGRSDEAISLIRQAIAIEPRNPDYHYNLGSILYRAGRAAEAIEQLKKAVALKPNYTEAHFELGNAYARTGSWERPQRTSGAS